MHLFNKASPMWDPVFSGLHHFILFWLLEAQGVAYSLARLAVNWEGSSWHAMAGPRLSCPLTQEPDWENYSHPGKQSEIRARLCSLALCAQYWDIFTVTAWKGGGWIHPCPLVHGL